jgi:hypothetical protein
LADRWKDMMARKKNRFVGNCLTCEMQNVRGSQVETGRKMENEGSLDRRNDQLSVSIAGRIREPSGRSRRRNSPSRSKALRPPRAPIDLRAQARGGHRADVISETRPPIPNCHHNLTDLIAASTMSLIQDHGTSLLHHSTRQS